MWLSLSVALASPLPSIPMPADATVGAVCRTTVHFADGEQSRVEVPAACPEPFRTAIRDQFTTTPLVVEAPPEWLDLRVSFMPGRAEGIVQHLEAEPTGFARPREGAHVHLPEDRVQFKKQRWPRTPPGLRQPVTCRVTLDFTTEGELGDVAVRGCPPKLTVVTREAVAAWRVKPVYQGVKVRIRTDLTITYGPS